MNRSERERQKHRPGDERGIGSEENVRSKEVDADLQREGNLGNERNRNRSDIDSDRSGSDVEQDDSIRMSER